MALHITHEQRRRYRTVALYTSIVLFLLIVLIPFYWIFASSLTDKNEIFSIPPSYVPTFTLENFASLVQQVPFYDYLRNSLVFGIGSTLVTVVIGFMAAYGFARFSIPGSNILLFGLVLSMALPDIVTVVPLFAILRDLSLIDKVTGLILVMSSALIPFTVWVLVSFVKRVPVEVEEAATIDGANLLQVLWRIVVPIMRPALATMIAINFVNAWNNLIYPLVFSSSIRSKTLSVAITEVFQARSPYGRPWELVSSLGVTMVVPVVILVFIAQRAIISGLTRGSIK